MIVETSKRRTICQYYKEVNKNLAREIRHLTNNLKVHKDIIDKLVGDRSQDEIPYKTLAAEMEMQNAELKTAIEDYLGQILILKQINIELQNAEEVKTKEFEERVAELKDEIERKEAFLQYKEK